MRSARVASVKRLLAELSSRGLFNIEFNLDARDGHYKIIEFNPRARSYTGTIASAGASRLIAGRGATQQPIRPALS